MSKLLGGSQEKFGQNPYFHLFIFKDDLSNAANCCLTSIVVTLAFYNFASDIHKKLFCQSFSFRLEAWFINLENVGSVFMTTKLGLRAENK